MLNDSYSSSAPAPPAPPHQPLPPPPSLWAPPVGQQPKPTGWGPWRGFLSAALAFVGAQIAAGLGVGFYAYSFTSTRASGDTWVNSVPGNFTFVLVAEALTLLILKLVLGGRFTLKSIGLGQKPQWLDFLRVFIIGAFYYGALLIALNLLSGTLNDMGQKQELGFDQVIGNVNLILTFCSLVIFPPIVEEIVFRGVLFSGFRTKMRFLPAALLTSALFAAPHIFEGSNTLLWTAGIDTFLLSIANCYLREKTGRLWASITLHMVKNAVAFSALYIFAVH